MDLLSKKNLVFIAIGLIVLALVVGGFWFWSKHKQTSPPLLLQAQETPTLGNEIFNKTQNKLEGKVPNANPFKEQKNPLDTIYKNPFE